MVGKFEINKDVVQEITESTATHVGKIATILSGAVREVTREVGDWVTDGIELREAARRAREDGADAVQSGYDEDFDDEDLDDAPATRVTGEERSLGES